MQPLQNTLLCCSTDMLPNVQACVANGSCTCFQALPNLTSCTNHSTILAPESTIFVPFINNITTKQVLRIRLRSRMAP